MLVLTSTPTSAYLQLRKIDIRDAQDGSTSSSKRSDVCRACGSILIWGWSSKIRRRTRAYAEKRRRPSKTSRKYQEEHDPDVCYLECVRCYSLTSIDPNIARTTKSITAETTARTTEYVNLQDSQTVAEILLPPLAIPESSESSPAPSNRKKRSRGKNSSLQAMLTKSKDQQTSIPDFGLSFTDLMKSD